MTGSLTPDNLSMDDYVGQQEPVRPTTFPFGPTERTKVYTLNWPETQEPVAIMSVETWTDFGTLLESLRAVARTQDKRLKEIQAAHDEAIRRLENLRAVRREEKRAEVAVEINSLIQGS